MTVEGQDRSTWTIAQQVRHERELREKRGAWEKQRKLEREEAERVAKQAALENHLAERSRLYLDHTGTTPSTSLLEGWRDEYIGRQARRLEAELEARRAASEENYDW